MANKRNYWGWGYAGFQIPPEILERYIMMLKGLFQIKKFEQHQPKTVEKLALRKPRFIEGFTK